MRWSRVLAGAAVLWITTTLGVVLLSLIVSNDLFSGPYAPAVGVSIFFLALCFLLVVAAVRPDRSWKRTPYW